MTYRQFRIMFIAWTASFFLTVGDVLYLAIGGYNATNWIPVPLLYASTVILGGFMVLTWAFLIWSP